MDDPMRQTMSSRRSRLLSRLLRHAWEFVAPSLVLVGLLALVAQVPK
jgi:hypothetical protein